MIGVQLSFRDPHDLIDAIRQAEEHGVDAVWLPQGGVSPDMMMLLAATSMVTQRIKLGTSIIPTWPRAPLFLAQQAMAMEALAPGRFRLGIGPSTQAAMREKGAGPGVVSAVSCGRAARGAATRPAVPSDARG